MRQRVAKHRLLFRAPVRTPRADLYASVGRMPATSSANNNSAALRGNFTNTIPGALQIVVQVQVKK